MAEDPLAWVPSVMDIDIDDPTIEGYQAAIKMLQDDDLARAGNGQAKLFRGVPITSDTAGWRRINFVSSDKPTTSILIDAVDSYLVAIRTGAGTWLSFGDRATPLPAGGPTMGIRSSYPELTADIDRYEIVFGTQIFPHIYHTLSTFNPNVASRNPIMKTQRKVLIQLAVLFCEAIRFKHLLEKLLEIMRSGQNGKLPRHMWGWLQNWSVCSKFALISKLRDGEDILEDDENDLMPVQVLGIHNRDDLAAFLGLILHSA